MVSDPYFADRSHTLEGSRTSALRFFAVHPVLALQFEG